jgi:aminopeptidase N
LPESSVKTFLKITSLGFILLYLSNHVDVTAATYPPFGINSLSLLPLASYFILFGLYSSALSLSQDITLRQHLRSIAKNDNNLLSSIGTAQMEREVNRAIGELKEVADEQEKELAEKTGIETPVPENEIEDYLKQVIEEVAKTRKK